MFVKKECSEILKSYFLKHKRLKQAKIIQNLINNNNAVKP